MATGKALVIHEHGGVDKLVLVKDFAFPEPKAGEILVKASAASVNPVDTYVRSGMYPAKSFPLVRPVHTLGSAPRPRSVPRPQDVSFA